MRSPLPNRRRLGGWTRPSLLVAALLAATLAGCGGSTHPTGGAEVVRGGTTGTYIVPAGIHHIQHVIVVMQENRSFDSYFGTYPGADGIPMANGTPTACVPDPGGPCQRSYHDTADVNGGGPHNHVNSDADVDGGKMDGFIGQRDAAHNTCTSPTDPACVNRGPADVMGYHTGAEIPNYWAYAHDFVLDDHMFEPSSSWSYVSHLFMVSGWSARCANRSASSCVGTLNGPYSSKQATKGDNQATQTGTSTMSFDWTDLTYLLDQHHVPWSYYVQAGTQPDCDDAGAETCAPVAQKAATPGIWNPLPLFTDVQDDHQIGDVKPLGDYLAEAKAGTLPSMSVQKTKLC